jgi:hypothetical protein
MLSRRMWMGVGVCLVALSGTALGQDAPPRQDPPPLKGPQVKQTRPPGLDEDFGEGMKPGKEGMRGPMIPMRAYAEVIDKLRGEKAPEGLRLSEEQEKKIGGIEQEFRDAAREYAQKMRAERGSQGDGQPEAKPGEPPREAMRQMMRNGPRPGDYQTQIWAVLSDKQQAYVKVELDKVRDEIQKKRSEEMMQRRLEQRRGGKGADQPNVTPVAGQEAAPLRERAQRIMRRMAQLPPEDRDRILTRLEEELDRRGIPDVPPPPPPPPPSGDASPAPVSPPPRNR